MVEVEAKRRKLYYTIFILLASIIVFCTVYLLILPAITMVLNKDDIPPVYCGMEEHVHNEGCTENRLICEYEEDHIHSAEAGCFKEKQPQCAIEEHTHTDECFTEEKVLTCTEEHEHTDDCYTVQKTLICEKHEHVHTAECYGGLVCTVPEGHKHTAECYREYRTCTKEEHTHTDECYIKPEKQPLTVGGTEIKDTYEVTDDSGAVKFNVTLHGEALADVDKVSKKDELELSVDLNSTDVAEILKAYDETADDVTPLMTVKFEAKLKDAEVDISDCIADVKLTIDKAVLDAAETALLAETDEESSAADEDSDMIIAAADKNGELDSVFITKDEDAVLNFSTYANEKFTVLRAASNPNFYVQHYFYFNEMKTENNPTNYKNQRYIPFLDASSGVNKIPENPGKRSGPGFNNGDIKGSSGKVIFAPLVNKNGSSLDGGEFVTESILTRLFESEKTDWLEKPQMNYMSRLYNAPQEANRRYRLKEIWVSKGPVNNVDESDKLEKKDFTVYELPYSADEGYTPKVSYDQIRFTNNAGNTHITAPDKPHKNWENDVYPYYYTILIEEGHVIRMVLETTTNEDYLKKDVNFFDYDITDGRLYSTLNNAKNKTNAIDTSKQTNGATYYVNTSQSGINSDENYKDKTGAYLTFGNTNTGVKLSTNKWQNGSKSLTLNGAEVIENPGFSWVYNNTSLGIPGGTKNKTTYGRIGRGSLFGITTGFTSEEVIFEDGTKKTLYTPLRAAGITSPALFSQYDSSSAEENRIIGKTSYIKDEFALKFHRVGSTYTLSNVSKRNDDNINEPYKNNVFGYSLETLTYLQADIYSNNFWPMDHADTYGADGHDPKFGSAVKGTTNPINKIISDTNVTFPISDDYQDHNSYFAMSFNVDFTLQPGYIAPLNYWFYGDDGMWVFLQELEEDQDGNLVHKEGDSGKLIADIGGVHQSIGEYVNLWDYLDPVPSTEKSPRHYRLVVFYTERGASGSSCYMRFTVPMVSNEQISPEHNEALVIEKQVLDVNGDETTADTTPFTFYLTLKNEHGVDYQDAYEYAIYDRASTPDHSAPNAQPVDTGVFNDMSAKGRYKFTLKGGQYIVITGMPDDLFYTIEEETAKNYVTSYKLGTHSHNRENGEPIDKFDNGDSPFRYSYIAGEAPQIELEKNNYIMFKNQYALKREISPGDGLGVQVGDEIEYEIEWDNDRNETATVLITDTLDPGLDLTGAALEDKVYKTEGELKPYNAENPEDGIFYNRETRTVYWRLSGKAASTEGLVYLKVKVNENAYEEETETGIYGDKDPRVQNQATVAINGYEVKTVIMENPVWHPVKEETSPGDGMAVGLKDTITYKVTWKNYLNKTQSGANSADVLIRDPLDTCVDYVQEPTAAKAFYYDSRGEPREVEGAKISYNTEEHTLYWELPNQPNGREGYVTFTVRVNDSITGKLHVDNRAYVTIGNKPEVETNIVSNPFTTYILPNTGGPGTTMFLSAGITLSMVGIIGYAVCRRRRERRSR